MYDTVRVRFKYNDGTGTKEHEARWNRSTTKARDRIPKAAVAWYAAVSAACENDPKIFTDAVIEGKSKDWSAIRPKIGGRN